MILLLRSPMVSCITNLWRWLERYPAPEQASWTRRSWVALALVTLAVVLFCGYFILYLTQAHQAYQTNAEDLGIMDQALWNTVHGQFLHQTVCNIVSDTNCVGENGIVRFAIHFEPILVPISLLYLFFPDPRTLLVLQTIIVALGAYPAFFLAQRRLRHTLLPIALALLYLLYPAQQQATVYDFHAVTLTSTFLLFVIYFMYTRRTRWMFACVFLAMACKEEISLVIVMLGLWSIILQHRWRSGLVLVVVGLLWFFLAVNVIMPYFSPTGHPLLIGRFDALGDGPLQVVFSIVRHPLVFLHQYVFESSHSAYLRILFIPALFLPLLAPWVMIIALPSILLNLISSNSQMYSGLFQYNAEIVPILLFATIEALVVLTRLVRYLLLLGYQWKDFRIATKERRDALSHSFIGMTTGVRLYDGQEGRTVTKVRLCDERKGEVAIEVCAYSRQEEQAATEVRPCNGYKEWAKISPRSYNGHKGIPSIIWRVEAIWLMALLSLALVCSLHYDLHFHGNLPFSTDFTWPNVSAHVELAEELGHMIPPLASVSAQSQLVPHLSERPAIYLFPYASDSAEYVFLDTTGDVYPYVVLADYTRAVEAVLSGGRYGILVQKDGFFLLKRSPVSPSLAVAAELASASGIPTLRILLEAMDETPVPTCASLAPNTYF